MDWLRRLFRKPAAQPMRDIAHLVMPFAEPALHVLCSGEPSLSHFGGAPRLPAGVPWPQFNGRRLEFLARLSLAEVQGTQAIDWLPASGALLFFYDLKGQSWGFDPKDRGSAAVLHVADLDVPVVDTGDDGAALPHRYVRFRRIDTYPAHEDEGIRALQLTAAEHDRFCDVEESAFDGRAKHQVAGYPAPVQGADMDLECQLVTNGLYCGDASGYRDARARELEGGAKDWRLLLQFDSDDDLGVMWGDAGTLYYWVKKGAARSGDFSGAWLIQQCC